MSTGSFRFPEKKKRCDFMKRFCISKVWYCQVILWWWVFQFIKRLELGLVINLWLGNIWSCMLGFGKDVACCLWQIHLSCFLAFRLCLCEYFIIAFHTLHLSLCHCHCYLSSPAFLLHTFLDHECYQSSAVNVSPSSLTPSLPFQ